MSTKVRKMRIGVNQKTTFRTSEPLGYRVRLTGLGLRGKPEIIAGAEAFDVETMDSLAFKLWRLPRGALIHIICNDSVELARFGTYPTLRELIGAKEPSVRDMILQPDATVLTHVTHEKFEGHSLLVVSPVIAHIDRAKASLGGMALTSGGLLAFNDPAR